MQLKTSLREDPKTADTKDLAGDRESFVELSVRGLSSPRPRKIPYRLLNL